MVMAGKFVGVFHAILSLLLTINSTKGIYIQCHVHMHISVVVHALDVQRTHELPEASMSMYPVILHS